ncbi:MAG TPA: glycosyltransferase [Candidatus Binataceae bacterium]|nr:glycosyltransferase [Candidatus Binataceae bacterium]
MKGRRKGRIVILHLAAQYPFAGVIWQLIHHLAGFSRLGLEVFYIEDNGAWAYDPVSAASVPDPSSNLKLLNDALARFGFADRWSFYDHVHSAYLGMSRARCLQLLAEADAVINLCGATFPREEHRAARMVYLETDPGLMQIKLAQHDAKAIQKAAGHQLFFSYGANLGNPDCLLPNGKLDWHPTRPPVLLDQWHEGVGPASPSAFTTVGTWNNKGGDAVLAGDTYFWSKQVNFRKMLDVAGRAHQPIELATDLNSGPDYEAALRGGFTFRPVVPMSLDLDGYRTYISSSRGEFTVAKDIYVRSRSGWFSDRSACYLAAGRPVVTQRTGFEKFIPEGRGLLGFDTADEAVEALRTVNADYAAHARAARELAVEYFDAVKLLDEIAEVIGL